MRTFSENQNGAAITVGMKSRKFKNATLGNGRSHPPQNNVTAIDEITIIAAYSARKKSENRNPLYSVWNPATSSDSASGKSNGARLFSATPQTKNSKNPTGCRKKYQ